MPQRDMTLADIESSSGRREYFAYSLDFNTTIAALAQGTVQTKTESDAWFVCESLQATLFTPAAVAPTIAGTPYSHEQGDVTVVAAIGNIFPTTAHFRLQITSNDRSWFLQPQRVSNICGTAERPHYLQTKRVIRPGATVFGILTNDVTATFGVQGQITISGYKLFM